MIPTLQSFIRALTTPDLSMKSLSGARAVADTNGMPHLMRTTRFAEAMIEWQGEQWLLSMPMSPSIIHHIERTTSQLQQFNTPLLAEYKILPNEMRWQATTGEQHSTDLVLQHLPAGKTFEQALLSEEKETLLAALDTLQAGLRELNFVHNNLKPENLRWCAGRLIPIRYHNARIGEGNDATAFETLRHAILQANGPQAISDTAMPYQPLRRLTGHRWTSHLFEGLICVEDEAGYGFVDPENRPIIAAQFLWAGDFHENRAEVETTTGMGLIDRNGHFIIPPEYEIVDYDPSTSISRVRLKDRWALFDYLGHRLTEFGPRNE